MRVASFFVPALALVLLGTPVRADDTVGPVPRSRFVLPVLLSAALPGAGEIVTGHWLRGLPLVAADLALWLGYDHYQDEGRTWRSRYEDFADTHWDYDAWQQNLETHYGDTQTNQNLRWWDPEAPYNCTCPYIPRSEDKQHYYENIGKYRFYWMGWEDWVYNDGDPRSSDSQARRREYADLRIQSNDNFRNATALVTVALASRLFSVVQTTLLVRGDWRRQSTLARVECNPVRLAGRGTGLGFRIRY